MAPIATKITAGLAGAALAQIVSTASASECHPPVPPDQMTLTFSDDFTGGTLDKRKWNTHPRNLGTINGEAQAYVPDAYEMIPGGGLRLRADRRAFAGQRFTSGEITTAGAFYQTYGHFEIKARLPAVNGAWPAFWLLNEDGAWPPEIDVLEYIYQPWGKAISPQNRSYAHFGVFWSPNSTTTLWKSKNKSPYSTNSEVYLTDNYTRAPLRPSKLDGDFTQDFHVFAVDWRPRELRFSVDGVEAMCWVEGPDTRDTVPSTPMYLIANLALSKAAPDPAGWAGQVQLDQPFPIYMDIASIKAYQFKDVPTVPPPSLVIGIPTVTPEQVKPGETVTVSTRFIAGTTDQTVKHVDVVVTSFDGKQRLAQIPFNNAIVVPAGQSRPFSFRYTVPTGLADGVYSIGLYASHLQGLARKDNFAQFQLRRPAAAEAN